LIKVMPGNGSRFGRMKSGCVSDSTRAAGRRLAEAYPNRARQLWKPGAAALTASYRFFLDNKMVPDTISPHLV
jgi:hypothetical protein